jgi:hypothetical protein
MSKLRTAYKIGMKAYKLGKKTRQANARKRAAIQSLKSAKNYYRSARTAASMSKTQTARGVLQAARGAVGKKIYTAKAMNSFAAAKASRTRSGALKSAADAKVKISKSLSAQSRATKKINTKGLGTRAAFAAGRIRKRTVAATAGVGFGANSLRGKKRKPMSAATKAKISKALKGRKRR